MLPSVTFRGVGREDKGTAFKRLYPTSVVLCIIKKLNIVAHACTIIEIGPTRILSYESLLPLTKAIALLFKTYLP